MKLRNVATILGLGVAAATMSACTVMGTGTGTVAANNEPVSFAWKSTGITRGTISATLGDGRVFTGTYEQLAPPDYLIATESKDYQDYVTPNVTADLSAPDGQAMSCRFRLVNTVGGMGEGARGTCRLGNTTIAAVLPRSLPRGV